MDETREQVADWLHTQLPGSSLLGAGTVTLHNQEVRAVLLAVPASDMLKVPGTLAQARRRFPHKTVRMVMWKGRVRLQVVDAEERPAPRPVVKTTPPAKPSPEKPAPNPAILHWSKPTRFGKLRVQSQHGTEAVVMPLKPGLWIVSEVPSAAVKEYGIAPFIPGALRAVGKLMRPQPQQPQVVVVQQPAQPVQQVPPAQPARRPRHRRTRPTAPAWMTEDDAAFAGIDLGCADCHGRCGRPR